MKTRYCRGRLIRKTLNMHENPDTRRRCSRVALSPPLSFASSGYGPALRTRFRTLSYSGAHVTHHTIPYRYYVRMRVLFRSTADTRPFFTRFSSVSFPFVSVPAPRRVFRRPANIAPPPTVSPAWQKHAAAIHPCARINRSMLFFSVLSRPTLRRRLLHIAHIFSTILQIRRYVRRRTTHP